MRLSPFALPPLLAALSILSVHPAAARAEPPPPEAKIHFESGKAYYGEEKWEEAIREFQRAYELSHYSDILLNIARAETRLGRDREAIGHLERYLEAAPDAEDSPAVRAELDARRKVQAGVEETARAEEARRRAAVEAASAKRRADEAAAREVENARRADEAARTARLRLPGWFLLAVGVVAVGGGIGAGVAAGQQANLVSGGGTMNPSVSSPEQWMGSYSAAFAGGQRDERVAIALDVVGGALAATGAALLIVSVRTSKLTPRATLGPSGGSIGLAGSF